MTGINTNMNAQLAANALIKNERAMSATMERLSTGQRINSAKDDAAGLGIATRMTTQVTGLNQAVRNANDGIAMIATADGAAVEITDMLQRMRELAVQAATSTVSAADVTNINVEFKQLAVGIEQIADNTQFNGMNVLNGKGRSGSDTDGSFTFNLGANALQTETIEFSDFQMAGGAAVSAVTAIYDFTGITTAALSIAKQENTDIVLNVGGTTNTIDVSTLGTAAVKATTSFAFTDANVTGLLDSDDKFTVTDGNSVSYAMDNMQNFTSVTQVVAKWNTAYAASSGLTASEKLNAAGATTNFVLTQTADPKLSAGNVMDVSDIVFKFAEGAGNARNVAAIDATISSGIQTHAAATDSTVAALTVANLVGAAPFSSAVNGFNLTDASGVLKATQATGAAFSGAMTSTLGGATETRAGVTAGLAGVMGADISGMVSGTITSTTGSILTTLDTAITGIESQRAKFGAMQNRLEHSVDNLTNVSQNASASLSRIQDADYAAETTELARTQIIAQAATAMLSQANQQAQSVLALLR